ncbi:hypothetical protein A3A54_00285 [Candidatus Curtissbacteria bacterium RIFCSPLOWO2_01_FULL_39_62]|uniref:PIN domain-containing protein n=2 Tax=Candidatus Curtissiibacteriota TaxID=1752717 RepID=A0A1F5GAP6_9BACT|nr:MAG: hypothetical protein A2775_00795 [Candidatus Curtissbacteria bacterium RIFCSPHIGHO2_01_FULL_39_57]OGD88953.1 MAG: hypothetical protein A3D04_02035 [Candidatus Curtissbacteria bacterium RIFCSPHIGHO2_02_FULL_40_16b]OGD90703.1 MAG: hypothetical protein A3E11_01030 [Candidatus Curtissbacteria bacterium RIFCSPHIGHO2_12_FULL_38_37]OGE00708.1 MAG: hypothetical protein A3J17_04100 [Candidatus Curtissbacteria bacterium RIFCSPLOWO2_02_FULL_40_11]OGE02452.1 MAG: hypothetical protein A3A54_00285 [C
MIFVDTNYFLRFLLEDVDSQHKEAKKLFLEAADGNLKLFTSIIVIFEINRVLSSFYRKDKIRTCSILDEALSFPFLKIIEKAILLEAIEKYKENNISLEDSYNLVFAKSRNAAAFKTFDAKLAKLFSLKI